MTYICKSVAARLGCSNCICLQQSGQVVTCSSVTHVTFHVVLIKKAGACSVSLVFILQFLAFLQQQKKFSSFVAFFHNATRHSHTLWLEVHPQHLVTLLQQIIMKKYLLLHNSAILIS